MWVGLPGKSRPRNAGGWVPKHQLPIVKDQRSEMLSERKGGLSSQGKQVLERDNLRERQRCFTFFIFPLWFCFCGETGVKREDGADSRRAEKLKFTNLLCYGGHRVLCVLFVCLSMEAGLVFAGGFG